MTRLKKIALTAGVLMVVSTFGHAWNVAEAKIAYLNVNKQGKVKVTYDYGDSYTLDVYVPPCSPYVPPCSPYAPPCYRDRFYYYVPGYWGWPYSGFLPLYPYGVVPGY